MLRRVSGGVIGITLIFFLVSFLRREHTLVEWVGGVLVAGSLVVLLLARHELGDAFSVRAKATRLVTTGVYGRVRNPIYVAGCVAIVGAALLSHRWWPLLVLVLLVPVQVRRARRETGVLRARFGEEYERYRRQTWF